MECSAWVREYDDEGEMISAIGEPCFFSRYIFEHLFEEVRNPVRVINGLEEQRAKLTKVIERLENKSWGS
jgi:hypothetical protein